MQAVSMQESVKEERLVNFAVVYMDVISNSVEVEYFK